MLHVGNGIFEAEDFTGAMSDADDDAPIVMYENVLSSGQFTADFEAGFNPDNMLNGSSVSKWKSDSNAASQVVKFQQGGNELNAIVIANHNFIPDFTSVKIERSSDDDEYTYVANQLVKDSRPIFHIFESSTNAYWKITITRTTDWGTSAPSIGNIFVGQYLRLPKKIFNGYTPIHFQRSISNIIGNSVSGQFLGKSVRSEWLENNISLSRIDQDYFRSTLAPFVNHVKTEPFIFQWRPDSFPAEVAFCWTTEYPQIANDSSSGTVSLDLRVRGIAQD